MRVLVANWRSEHPEQWEAIATAYAPRKKELDAAYALANPERRRKAAREYARRHADKIRLIGRAWSAMHRARRNAQEQARRDLIAATDDGSVDYVEILARDGMVCRQCGGVIESLDDLHFDHVLALKRGGAHAADNIAPTHAHCNLSKGARLQMVT